jgi:hypothetical protein
MSIPTDLQKQEETIHNCTTNFDRCQREEARKQLLFLGGDLFLALTPLTENFLFL